MKLMCKAPEIPTQRWGFSSPHTQEAGKEKLSLLSGTRQNPSQGAEADRRE